MDKYIVIVASSTRDALESIRKGLSPDDYALTPARSGREVLEKLRSCVADLVVADLPLSDTNGLSLVRLLKRHPSARDIPVVLLLADPAEARNIDAAEYKPDDYLTQPFSPSACVAVIQAVLARTRDSQPDRATVTVGELTIDPVRFRVQVGPRKVDLTVTEFRVLQLLASRPGQVFVRDQIIAATRGDCQQVTDRSVDVHITGIRRKFGEHGDLIETVRGLGYRLQPKDPAS